MKLALIALTVLAGAFAQAETANYDLKGVHCDSCKASIEGSVCKAMADQLSSCSAEVIDEKKQTGKLVLVSKDGKKIDDTQVLGLVAKAGEYTATRAKAPAAKKK